MPQATSLCDFTPERFGAMIGYVPAHHPYQELDQAEGKSDPLLLYINQ